MMTAAEKAMSELRGYIPKVREALGEALRLAQLWDTDEDDCLDTFDVAARGSEVLMVRVRDLHHELDRMEENDEDGTETVQGTVALLVLDSFLQGPRGESILSAAWTRMQVILQGLSDDAEERDYWYFRCCEAAHDRLEQEVNDFSCWLRAAMRAEKTGAKAG